LNVAAVPVMILSVEATPINPEPLPMNDVAVMTPATFIPKGKFGDPVPALFVILSTLNFPAPPVSVPGSSTSVPIPRISGINVSPSATLCECS